MNSDYEESSDEDSGIQQLAAMRLKGGKVQNKVATKGVHVKHY